MHGPDILCGLPRHTPLSRVIDGPRTPPPSAGRPNFQVLSDSAGCGYFPPAGPGSYPQHYVEVATNSQVIHSLRVPSLCGVRAPSMVEA